MKLKALALLMSLLALPSAFAASELCYEFIQIQVDIQGVPARPGIVTSRHVNDDGRVVTFSQEVVPLNEDVQDVLATFEVGNRICLKGTRGYGSYPKFFAYSARRE